MYPRHVKNNPKQSLSEHPRLPGASAPRRVRVRVRIFGQDTWWYYAENEDEAIRYKRDVIEEHGRAGVSVTITTDNNPYMDNPQTRLDRYRNIGENAANGKKKARSVAGSAP